LGWRWFQTTVTNQIENAAIAGYVFNLRDITDRKQAALALEAALETQRAAIAELERLNQSKSRFLSTISHEFRTPLTAIIGYSEFLIANASDPAAVAGDAAIIHREASRLNRMVDDVLLLDRANAGRLPLQREPLRLDALLDDVVAAFRPLTGRHRIVVSIARDLLPVEGDRDLVLQAVTNLVSNAVKYSPGGGTVTIAARNDGDNVVLSVQDEGFGIAPADLPRIFDRFERIESGIAGRISGAGLGLSIVREIAALHGGHVWAESEPGIGSTFFLALPAERATG
jgi:signal transduction histidine kinase